LSRFLTATDVAQRVDATTRLVNHFAFGRSHFHGEKVQWLDRLSPSFFIAGPAVALLLLFLLLALDRYLPRLPDRAAKVVRTIADSTFTLYLVHLAIFVCLFSFIGHTVSNWRIGSVIFAVVIAISIGLAAVFDRLKNWMRTRLRARFIRAR
jgi:peptidoglycan/LPS O-acetylase OafA/YrhL